MNLHKKRNFNDLINDTFGFMKTHGGSYFKQFFFINGGLLLILILLMYLTFTYYLESLFSNINGISNPMDIFINNNPLFFGLIALVFVLLIILISLINFTFPLIYLNLIDNHPLEEITTKFILKNMKSQAKRILLFFVVLILITIPLLIIYLLSLQLYSIFLLLIPIYLVAIPIIISLVYQAYFHFLIHRKNLSESFQLAFETLKLEFWPIIGSTVIIFIIIQVAQTILTIIPYMIAIFSLFVDASPQETDTRIGIVTALISGIFVFMILLNYTFNNLLSINQGMIYYSFMESKDKKSALGEIDLIGKDEN